MGISDEDVCVKCPGVQFKFDLVEMAPLIKILSWLLVVESPQFSWSIIRPFF